VTAELKAYLYFFADTFFLVLLDRWQDAKAVVFISSPREIAGDVESDELDWDKTVLGSWLCIMFCTIWRYSSSVLAEARRVVV